MPSVSEETRLITSKHAEACSATHRIRIHCASFPKLQIQMATNERKKQALGLDSTNYDSAYIRRNRIVQSEHTRKDPLCLALSYAIYLGLNPSYLSAHYQLREATLCDIKKGVVIKRKRREYMESLVRALNDCRMRAISYNKETLAEEVRFALSELALVMCSLATDDEVVERRKEVTKANWKEKSRHGGYEYNKERLKRVLDKA